MSHWTQNLGKSLSTKQAFTASSDMAAGDPAAQAAAGGGAPPAGGGDPSMGGGAPPAGVAPDPTMADPSMGGMVADPSMQQPMQPGMPGQPMQPGMPGAPTPKIDEGLVSLQILRMLTKVIEHVRGGGDSGEGGADAGGGGGGMAAGGGEEAGGQPAGVSPGMGDDQELQSRIQQALDQVQAGMRGLVQPSGDGKPKVEMKVALLYIQKLAAALVDMCGIPIPASHMVTTPEDVMQAGGQGQTPPSGAPAGEGFAQPLQPVQPIQPVQGQKTANDFGLVPMPQRSSLGARVRQALAK